MLATIVSRPLFTFRVVVYYDQQHSTWVAVCLETGHLVTADDSKTAESMIVELLGDEARYNLKWHKPMAAFANPADWSAWELWKANSGCKLEMIDDLAELLIVAPA